MAPDPTGLICWGRPPTANKPLSRAGRQFLDRVRSAYVAAGGPNWSGLLYGGIYWFVRDYDARKHPDADNISKKIWDEFCLQGIAYRDDSQVRVRTAAVVAIGIDLEGLPLSDLPDPVIDALPRLLAPDPGDEDAKGGCFAYIECGRWDMSMLRLRRSGLFVAGGAP